MVTYVPDPRLTEAHWLAGMPVIVSQALRYDEMYIGRGTPGVVVGEYNQLVYRLEQLALNKTCRETARAALDEAAIRILGEPLHEVPAA